LRQFFHVPRIPYPTAQRNSFRDPGHVHAAFRWPSRPNPQSASDDYSDSTSPFPPPSLLWMHGWRELFAQSQFLDERLCHRLLFAVRLPYNRKRARFASRPSEFFVFRLL